LKNIVIIPTLMKLKYFGFLVATWMACIMQSHYVYAQKKADSTYTTRLEALKTKSKRLQSNLDSLPGIIKGFEALYAESHDKTALATRTITKPSRFTSKPIIPKQCLWHLTA
jgi:hypothetical protein